MKLLEFSNKAIMWSVIEQATLKIAIDKGANKTLTLDDNSDLAQNDLILSGEIGATRSEISKINAAVVAGTAIQLDNLVFAHSPGTPLYKLPYDKVKFYYSATLGGAKSLLSTLDLDVDNEYTTYLDTVNATGYGFFTLYNSVTADESGFSAGFDYANAPIGSRIMIRTLVSKFYKKPIDDETFAILCDLAESEIFAIQRWRFREKISPFNTVAGQQSYPLSASVPDLGQMVYATYDGYPVWPIDIKLHKAINNHSVISGIPSAVYEFEGKLFFSPIPSAIKAVEIFHYRNSSGFVDETYVSSVQLPQAIAFRVLQDLWSPEDSKKGQIYERRYMQLINAMKLNDIKQVTKFSTLTDNRLAGGGAFNAPEDNPNQVIG